MRVFELAKQVGLKSKELVQQLDRLGHPGLTHMSAVDETTVQRVLKNTRKSEKDSGLRQLRKKPLIRGEEKGKRGEEKEKEKKRILVKRRKVEGEDRQATPLPVHVHTPSLDDSQPIASPPSSREFQKHESSVTLQSMPHPQETADEATPSETLISTEQIPLEGRTLQASPLATPVTKIISDEAPAKTDLTISRPDGIEVGQLDMAAPPVKETNKAVRRPGRVRDDFREDAIRWKDLRALPSLRRDDRQKHPTQTSPADITRPRRKIIKLYDGLTVKSFAETIGQKPTDVIRLLMDSGLILTLNQLMDPDAAVLIADHFGLKVEVLTEPSVEDLIDVVDDPPSALIARPPVVTIMGHVDHGKTSLLDAIRKTRVTASEAGGITQHIGAYTTKLGDKTISFLDTPGHEAFTAIRARGVKTADIVLLVVAADDGVMTQTIEAIHHAKAAEIPIIVVINKIDQPTANPDRVKRALADHGLISEAWGGQTIYAEVSAKFGTGIETLLELILLQAEMLELRANPHRSAKGVVIEAKLDRGRGPVATVLVQTGTLRVGDAFVVGAHAGRVRALLNEDGRKISEVTPSLPAEVIGLSTVPQSGDLFVVVKDERIAREVAKQRQERQRTKELGRSQRVTLDDLYSKIQDGVIQDLNLVIKADVQGSAEALSEALDKLSTGSVRVKIIHNGVGGITETDVLLASASNAIVLGFNIRPEPKAATLAEREGVDIRLYGVIYDAINDVKRAMEGLLQPIMKERVMGRAEVRQLFTIPKVGVVAGSYVTDGSISRSSGGVRVIRDNVVVYQGTIGSLKRFKDDVREASMGYECGISVQNFNDMKIGDVIEAFQLEEDTARSL